MKNFTRHTEIIDIRDEQRFIRGDHFVEVYVPEGTIGTNDCDEFTLAEDVKTPYYLIVRPYTT